MDDDLTDTDADVDPCVVVSKQVIGPHHQVHLCLDLMCVCGLAFLTSASENI